MARIIGIDLGTTYSAVAYARPDRIAEIIANAEGHRTTPSVVSFDEHSVYVGTCTVSTFRLKTFQCLGIRRHKLLQRLA